MSISSLKRWAFQTIRPVPPPRVFTFFKGETLMKAVYHEMATSCKGGPDILSRRGMTARQ